MVSITPLRLRGEVAAQVSGDSKVWSSCGRAVSLPEALSTVTIRTKVLGRPAQAQTFKIDSWHLLRLPWLHPFCVRTGLPASSTPQLERAWDAWQAERYQRGEISQRPGYTGNPFRPR